jgi:outer membrane protein assembly factor BamE (lipoprotein component of BamABCDE complex)
MQRAAQFYGPEGKFRMTVVTPARPQARLAIALACGALAVGACTPLRGHSGYIVDAELVNSVQPGVDTRDSVQQTLGKPTFTGQFGNTDWYYLARDTKNYAFQKPRVSDQITLKIAFDPNGVVQNVTRTDEQRVASIEPSKKVTPTLGRKRSFFAELFGNIGAVGAPGLSGGDSTNPDDRP